MKKKFTSFTTRHIFLSGFFQNIIKNMQNIYILCLQLEIFSGKIFFLFFFLLYCGLTDKKDDNKHTIQIYVFNGPCFNGTNFCISLHVGYNLQPLCYSFKMHLLSNLKVCFKAKKIFQNFHFFLSIPKSIDFSPTAVSHTLLVIIFIILYCFRHELIC